MGRSRYDENLRFFGLPFLGSRLWKKPVISLNQSFVIDRDADRAAAVNIFGRFEVVALREGRSLERCLENRIDTAVLCPDMAFLDALNTAVSAPVAPGARGLFLYHRFRWVGTAITSMITSTLWPRLHVEPV